MSRCSEAATAKERAAVAISMIMRPTTIWRAFDDCFEMGDGAAVVREIRRRAAKDELLRIRLRDLGMRNMLPRQARRPARGLRGCGCR